MKELVLSERKTADDMAAGFMEMVDDMLTEVLNAQDEKKKVSKKYDHIKHISAIRLARQSAEKAKSSELTTQLVDVYKLYQDSQVMIGNLLVETAALEP